MDNVSLYRKIDYAASTTGYYGYAYNCTSASNLVHFFAIDPNATTWKADMNY